VYASISRIASTNTMRSVGLYHLKRESKQTMFFPIAKISIITHSCTWL